MSKPKVLFLCTHNSARSQMAEGLLRHLAGDRFDAYSAGLEATTVHPLALRAMAEIGIDVGGQRSKALTEYLGKVDFGYVITVCGNAEERCPLFPGAAARLHWPFDDPAAVRGTEEERLAAFRRVRDEIAARIRQWVG
ncbi:MAG: arsenate reductase ArsC [Anaerolineae bacterium]